MNASMPIRVVLVDDHRSVLWGLERLIESEKSRMTVVGKATNVASLLELIDAQTPDIIVLDLDLGAENSLSAIPEIVARSTAKVLVLTGLRDPAIHDKAILAGAKGVVEKEERAETILDAIQAVHRGEFWLGRRATGRILELSLRKAAQTDPELEKIATLTQREKEIVVAIATQAGATAKKIAESLNISEHTLRNHFTSVYEKLGVVNRLELFAYAHKHGLHHFQA